jgi:ribosome-associated protein
VITDIKQQVHGCAQALADSRALDTCVMDLTSMSSWTDYFVVASATSFTHMRGLLRNLEEFTAVNGIDMVRRPRLQDEDEWCLIDFGTFVVHIMSAGAREFYDLESLWHESVIERVVAREGSSAEPDPA